MGTEKGGGGEHTGESLTCDQRLLEKMHYLSLSVPSSRNSRGSEQFLRF